MSEENKEKMQKFTSLGKILEIHKFLWFPVALFFKFYFNSNTIRSSLMTGFFGSYGILWVIKSKTFPDKTFYYNQEYQCNYIESIINFLSISVYFLFPYLASINQNEITEIEVLISVMLFSIGEFYHYVADAQKFYTLKYKEGLITEGLFYNIRHPNYFGEFLMWFSLLILSGYKFILSYIPIIWLSLATILIGIPKKEKSLERYTEFEWWFNHTWSMIPKLA